MSRRSPAPPRRGAVLPATLLMLVLLTALAGGSFAMSRQSFRGGRNAMVEQRAFAVAEAGLNQQIGGWDPALNGIPSAGGVPINGTVDASIFVANGDTAYVKVTRLDPLLFTVQSLGRASIPNPALQSTRNVAALVRIAYPTINPMGAITTNGDVSVQGNAFQASGNDRVPYAGSGSAAWDAKRCAGLTGSDTYAVAVPPTAKVSAKASTLTGVTDAAGAPSVRYDTAAANPNTYIAFGTETMNTLIQNADLVFDPSGLPSKIQPSIYPDKACKTGYADPGNWGEPNGDTTLVTRRCQTYFPIIYIKGSASISGNGRGQGILIVDGDLQINGTFDWLGLVLVKDDMNKGNGTATITGAVMARNVDMRDASIFGGNQTVGYSKCAVESALRGSAILIRVRDRAWTQLF